MLVRMLLASVIMALLPGTSLAATSQPSPLDTAPALESEEISFVTALNGYRRDHGAGPLAIDATLNGAAEWMSIDLAANGYVSHDDSLGRTPWARMCDHGYCFDTYKAENIGVGYSSAGEILAAWRASAPHDENLLGEEFTVIGVARVCIPGSTFGCYWTAEFAGHMDSGDYFAPVREALAPAPPEV